MPFNPVDEIKQRIDLADLIQEYVKLTPAGTNFKARCPFHNEKTPSFMVSPDKQIWHCFGCGQGGDHFQFIKLIEGVEFPEALRILAKRANIQLEYQNPEWHNQKTRLLDLVKTTAEYWHQSLLKNSEAGFVREYLKKRSVTEDTLKAFQLGYAKESWDDAIKYLQAKKFTLREIEQAGISTVGEKQRPYDRFRNRLMFPIRDIHGNVAGFTGRILTGDEKIAKYINSPQSVIYNKSQILYNLDQAKLEIRKKDYAILVEGNMDALSAYQAGTKNVVAVSGTALTLDQIKLLKRFTLNVMIAFDADIAGLAANLRGIDLAWQEGFNVKVVHLGESKDPDELIKKDPEQWKDALRTADNFLDYIFKVTLKDLDLSRVDHKKKAAKKLLTVIAKLGDDVERAHYLRKLSDILDVPEETLGKTLKIQEPKSGGREVAEKPMFLAVTSNQNQLIVERLLALIIKFPDYLKDIFQRLDPEVLTYQPAYKLYKEIIIYYNKEDKFVENEFARSLDEDLRFYFNRLSLLIGETDDEPLLNSIHYEILQLVNRLKQNYLKDKLQRIEAELKAAEKKKDLDQVEKLSREFSILTQQLQEF